MVTWEWIPSQERITASDNFASLYGLPARDGAEEVFALVLPEDKDAHLTKVRKIALEGGSYESEFRIRRRNDGQIVWLEERAEALADQDGTVERVIGVTLDITNRKQVEEALREREEALRQADQQHRAHLEQEVASRTSELELRVAERDALLKEVHHRVKNNLQVIASMLEMQARRTDDVAAFRQLEEACNRVMSIAQIHELLYQSGSLAGVDLTGYAAKLVPQLVAFYNMEDRVEIAVQGESVSIDLERAVPCGLLLNELVSNTCKHAFPGNDRGRLTVRLTREDEQIRLTVEDTGIGLPAGLDLTRLDSLGLTIVRLLTDHLGGSMTVRNGAGTSVQVQFSAAK